MLLGVPCCKSRGGVMSSAVSPEHDWVQRCLVSVHSASGLDAARYVSCWFRNPMWLNALVGKCVRGANSLVGCLLAFVESRSRDRSDVPLAVLGARDVFRQLPDFGCVCERSSCHKNAWQHALVRADLFSSWLVAEAWLVGTRSQHGCGHDFSC